MVTFLLWAGRREILVFYFDRGSVALHPAEEGAPCSGAEPRGPGRYVRLDRESGCANTGSGGESVRCRANHTRGYPINPTPQCFSLTGPCTEVLVLRFLCMWLCSTQLTIPTLQLLTPLSAVETLRRARQHRAPSAKISKRLDKSTQVL